MYLADSHLHTMNSFDAKGTLLDKANFAKGVGVERLCVTDHFECQNPEKWTAVSKMKRDYEAQKAMNDTGVELYFGIELGSVNLRPDVAEEVIKEGDFDMVIGSLHVLEDCVSIGKIDYASKDIHSYIDRYLKCLEDIVNYGDFDTLAHINMTVRYAAMQGVALSMEPYYDRLYKMFKTMVQREKALEINMSSVYSPLEAPLPTADVLKLYKEAGGELLTVGSDAHLVEHVGRGVEDAYNYAKEAGFDKITVYARRKPEFIYLR